MTIDDEDAWREEVTKPSAVAKTPRPPLRVVPQGERDQRPDVRIQPDVHLTTDAMADALRADPDLYQRAGQLAQVIRTDEAFPGAVPGTPITRTIPLSTLTDRVSEFARCVKHNKKTDLYVRISPPIASVRAVFDRGSWRGIRELRGILEAPSLRPDGTVIQTPGYDRATGYIYEPNATFPAIEEAPTHAQAVDAFAKLLEPFADFPYVNEAHRSATIAGLFTLLARPAIQGSVPCWLFDASAARSGKSLQVDVISIIATGRAASRMTYPELDEELEKVLSSYAMRGASMVNFDNVARSFGGAALDKVITAVDKVDLRVLGSTDLRTVDWLAVIFASGNNVTCRGDMLARVLSPRIETPLDNPEKRTDLAHDDLRAWTREHRADLACAALTVLRGYLAAGSPDMGCPRWGGFEAWSRLIPHALVWVGAADPMGARRGLDGDQDPERIAGVALIDGWARLCATYDGPEGFTVKRAIEVLYPPRSREDDGPPDGLDGLREAIDMVCDSKPGFPPATKRLSIALGRLKSKPIGGRKFATTTAAGGIVKWRVERVA